MPTVLLGFILALAQPVQAASADLEGINVALKPQSDGAVEIIIDEAALVRTGATTGERILERSADLQSWSELARLSGSAGSRFVDEHPPVGRGFYRVRVDPSPAYVPGEILVQFLPDADPTALEALYADAGLVAPIEITETKAMTDSGTTPVVRFTTSLDPLAAADILNASPLVLLATPDMAFSMAAVGNDPDITNGKLWGMSGEPFGTDAFGAWAGGKTGSNNVVVAVIDTGVGPHPDLDANRFVNPLEIPGNNIDDDGNGYVDDVCGWDFANSDPDASDDNGHGTHVAGTIGAVGNNGLGVAGVCWSVRILPLKVLGAEGGGSHVSIARAIDYVTDLRRRGINIVAMNLSLGSGPTRPDSFGVNSALIHDALVRAAEAGVVAVCAAGNDANNNDVRPVIPANINTTEASSSADRLKATWDNVISVAAMNRGGLLSYYSNYGLRSVDLAAPGGDQMDKILSTYPGGYKSLMGTSMSAPHVSGALALYASNWTTGGARLRQVLLESAIPATSQSGRSATGGRLNVARFVAQSPNQNNRSPITVDDVVPLALRRAIEINPLANDSDPDGHALSIAGFSIPKAGTVTRHAQNASVLIYTPGSSFQGNDTFSYTVADSAGATSLGSIAIIDPNLIPMAPVISDDEVAIEAGHSLSLRALLWNDRDPNGDRIRLHCAGAACGLAPTNGVISGGEYTPYSGFAGDDSFAYAITDGTFVATGMVNVTVLPVGGAPRGRVILFQPEDGGVKVRRIPLFRWKALAGANTYDLEICRERPGRYCYGYTGIAAREFRLPATDALPPNTKCFWRVRPVGANGAPGKWCAFRSFTSRAAAPPDKRARLVWPPAAAAAVPVLPNMTWETVEDADAYQLQIARGLPETTNILPGHSVETATPSWQVPPTLALENGQVYFWRVMARNEEGDGYWTEWQPFCCGEAAPGGKPALRSPATGATGVSLTPSFDWNDLGGAATWRLEIRRKSDSAVIFDLSGIGSSQYTLGAAVTLTQGQSYEWRVQPANASGTGLWSDRWTFRTRSESPVSLQSPANNAANLAKNVTLSWSAASGADGYDYEVYDGSTLIAGYGITYSGGPYRGTSVSLDFSYGRTYDWRVRARILPQDNPWTSMRSFTIKDAPPFNLLSPTNAATGLNRSVTLSWSTHPDADGYDFEVLDGNTVVAGYGINYSDGPYRSTSVSLTLDYGKTYRWRARARILDNNNPWTSLWSFTIKGDPGFSLISPADGAAGLPVSVRLDWNSHPDADGYDFEVYDGGTKVAGMGITYSGGPYRGTAVTVTLGYGKTFTWRARPRILPQDNPWSASRSFATEAPPPVLPGVPQLSAPAHHATGVARPVTFDWNAAPNAVRYRLEVWYQPSDGGARQRVLNKSVTTTSYKAGSPDPDPLGPGRNYYWKVLGINSAGQEGPWSSERHFSTRTTQ